MKKEDKRTFISLVIISLLWIFIVHFIVYPWYLDLVRPVHGYEFWMIN